MSNASARATSQSLVNAVMFPVLCRVDTLDDDTRHQFEQVYEAILGLMSPAAKKQ